jgi:hypothetical protein
MHELSSIWVFWFSYKPTRLDKAELALQYENKLVPMCEVRSVEDFFNSYCFIKRPSEMTRGQTLHLFKEGFKPLWETSLEGGCWILKLPRFSHFTDKYWEALCFACIGGRFPDSVSGVLASAKGSSVHLQIWTEHLPGPEEEVAQIIKEILALSNTALLFKSHRCSIEDMSTIKNATPVILN